MCHSSSNSLKTFGNTCTFFVVTEKLVQTTFHAILATVCSPREQYDHFECNLALPSIVNFVLDSHLSKVSEDNFGTGSFIKASPAAE